MIPLALSAFMRLVENRTKGRQGINDGREIKIVQVPPPSPKVIAGRVAQLAELLPVSLPLAVVVESFSS